MTDGQFEEAKRLMTKLLVGKTLGEVIKVGDFIKEEFEGYRNIFDGVMNAIEEYIVNDKVDIVMEGEGKILNHPEYNDSEKVKNFLSVVTSKDKLADLFEDHDDNIEINIKVGGPDGETLPDCSLVTATYSLSGEKIGTYGVIGPLRMDYQKVVSVLEGVGKILEDILNNK